MTASEEQPGSLHMAEAINILKEEDRNEEKAVAILQECAKKQDSKALWMLGLCYEYGIGVEVDEDHARAMYSQASTMGSNIGTFLYKNITKNGAGDDSLFLCGMSKKLKRTCIEAYVGLLHSCNFTGTKLGIDELDPLMALCPWSSVTLSGLFCSSCTVF